jgi:hypothetical protein
MARYNDDDYDRSRRARDERSSEIARRDSLMQRRLRVSRGEEVDEQYVDDHDDDYDDPRGYSYIPPEYAQSQRGPSGCAAMTLYLVLGFLTVFLVIMLVGRQAFGGIFPALNTVPERVQQIIATPTPTIFDRGGTIQQIRSLNRLETQSFAVERVVEASVERGNLLDTFLGDRLLLIASGNVIAGVDLSKLSEEDIVVSDDGTSVTLRLPASEIFVAALDNNRTRVYDRQTGFLADQQRDLETQARQEAERQILQAACEGQITEKAASEAKRSMEQFLSLLDFDEVNVIAPIGACVAPPTVQTLPTATP